jgi:hypothetical protein
LGASLLALFGSEQGRVLHYVSASFLARYPFRHLAQKSYLQHNFLHQKKGNKKGFKLQLAETFIFLSG